MPGRLSQSTEFERALRQPAWARSAHFAVHFVPQGAPLRDPQALSTDLSTIDEQSSAQLVDDSTSSAPGPAAAAAWLGTVVPKRHARRGVTRSLLKREMRAAASRPGASGQPGLPAGVWVVRLRAPFDRARFVSAASPALRDAARAELEALFDSARRCSAGAA